MKNKLILIISILFIIPFILTVKSMAAEPTYTQEQKAIREVADAYYQRGINAQYCNFRLGYNNSPEEATSQNTIYNVCSNLTYLVYKQAFDIDIQGGYASTDRIMAYAKKYYDANNIKTNDVIEYWQKITDVNNNVTFIDNKNSIRADINLSTDQGKKDYAKKVLEEYNLQVGDILCFHTGDSGHALIVYEIIYDENNKPVDALIRESTSEYEQKSTKINKGLSYRNVVNENTYIDEGTFRERSLANTDFAKYKVISLIEAISKKDRRYFTIIRPLLQDNNGNYTRKYYFPTFEYDKNAPTNYNCIGREMREYQIAETTQQRLKYNSIYIEKIVDVFNGSVVNLGDTLEYTIKIENNSDSTYDAFDVIENIPEYVEIIDEKDGIIRDNILIWNIQELKSKQSIEIKYKVKVKNNISYLGQKIISTGTVAGIPSSTVKNVISYNLDNDKKSIIAEKTQSLMNSNKYSGQGLISKIYENSFGNDINLNKFNITDLIKVVDGIDYYPLGSLNLPSIYLNYNNEFLNMVLSDYYGGLYTSSSGYVSLKKWENAPVIAKGRDYRKDTIYKEHFQTGDILIYKNTQTANENVTYKTEDGTYYLIYIDEKDKITVNNQEIYGFVGINDNGEINHIGTDRTSLQTLLGKDYYVVLRPSMSIDIVPMNLGISYSTTQFTNGGVKVTITSNEEMLPVSGWTLSSNKKKLTKTFTKNIDKKYSIYDLAGNKVTVKIKIDNIVEKMGDINKDSKINIADLVGVIRHIGSKEGSKYYLDEEKRFIADINQDGKINIADVIGIIRLISTSK